MSWEMPGPPLDASGVLTSNVTQAPPPPPSSQASIDSKKCTIGSDITRWELRLEQLGLGLKQAQFGGADKSRVTQTQSEGEGEFARQNARAARGVRDGICTLTLAREQG